MNSVYSLSQPILTVALVLSSILSTVFAEAVDPNDPAILTLDRIITDEDFKSASFGPARWLEDGSGYTTLEETEAYEDAKDIVKYDPASGQREVLVAAARLMPQDGNEPLSIDDYSWSEDGSKLLIFTNSKRVWRRNTRGDYWVLNLDNDELIKLGADAEASRLMFAKFSPDGTRVGYVYKNNIYVQSLRTQKIRQLTRDGSDIIVNGTSDWVYEEEFGLRDGFRFSPDSRYIAFWHFDTSGVEEFKLINYTDALYPKITSYQYPKVGQVNSACYVGVVRVKGGRPRLFKSPGDPRNSYIPRMQWMPDSSGIIIQHLNRLQNTCRILFGAVNQGGLLSSLGLEPFRTIFTDQDDAWLDLRSDLEWVDQGKRFLWLSDRDGWRHIWLVSVDDGEAQLLTPGPYDVVSIQTMAKHEGYVYFMASPDNPTQRYLHRVPLAGEGSLECVTPILSPGTHAYQMSQDAQWAIHTYSSFTTPSVIDLVSLPEHRSVRVLQANQGLQAKVQALSPCPTEFFRVDIGEGVLLDAWCIKPPDFDPSQQYPLLFYVYGEPAGQTVLDRWGGRNSLWHRMLAQQGAIVISIDNRGTPGPRGRDWRKSVYRQIGILASSDQAAAAQAIIKDRPYVDPNRVGIWGWSGGGSMTLNALFRYPELYKTGVAIAFIANQRYYDTIYQERYMGLPQDNEEGFTQGSPITFAHQLQGRLMIVYGTGDDNCHFQNCQALINELVKHNKPFSMMSYPNRTHSIKEGEGTTLHLYTTMTRYLMDNLIGGQ
jgi:dipeptidyl-peptidase 4